MRPTLKQVGAGVAATVAALASLVGVLAYIDQKRADEPPPERKTPPEIEKITLHDRAEPLRDFLRKTPDSKGRSYTPAELRQRGYSFLLDVRAHGPVGTRLRLRWRLLAGSDPVPGRDYSQVASDFKSSALDQEAEVPVWVPRPIAPGRYVVRFTFQRLDDDGRAAGFASEKDSAPFVHLRSQSGR
jgi:hypothetical protein